MNYLNEAFKKLDMLNEEDFSLTNDGIDELKKFRDGDDLDIITVIDPKANSEEDLQDSYVGKVILDCEVCHSKIYKDPSEVNVDNELNIANKEDECPFCYSNEGFKVIGQVADFNPTEEVKVDKEDEDTEVTVDGKEVEEEPTNESLQIDGQKQLKENAFNGGYAENGSLDTCKSPEGLKESTNYQNSTVIVGYDKHNKKGEVCGVYDNSKLSQDDILKKKAELEKDPESKGYTFEVMSAEDAKKKGIEFETTNESLDESFENVSIDTGSEVINVTTEPKDPDASAEAIVPVEDDVAAQIETSTEEEVPAEEETELEVDEIVEESFDYLSESYLKKVYGNVESYRTTAAKASENKIILEGIIKFTSGKEKQTSYIFEAKDATRRGKVRFIGENAQITKGKKAFSFTGSLDNNKLLVESLNYNYRTKDAEGKSTRVYGTIKKES